MPIKIIMYARTFIILVERVDTSVRKLRFVSLTKLIKYILDTSSIRTSYASSDLEIINKIPYRNIATRYENAVITALET